MYKLTLTDGTIIEGLRKLNPSTFEVAADNNIYNLLTDANLEYATLEDENDPLNFDILIDYTRQSFSYQNGIAHFRLASIEELKQAEKRRKRRR